MLVITWCVPLPELLEQVKLKEITKGTKKCWQKEVGNFCNRKHIKLIIFQSGDIRTFSQVSSVPNYSVQPADSVPKNSVPNI